MKLHFTRLLILLALIFSICATGTAQTTSPSTPTSPALSNAQRQVDKEAAAVNRETDALRLELRIRRLIDEVKSARQLIGKQREELASADKQIAKEKENSASLEMSRALLANEAQHLLKATDELTGAIELKSQTIGVLQKQNTELKSSRNKWRSRSLWATLAAGAVSGLLILK